MLLDRGICFREDLNNIALPNCTETVRRALEWNLTADERSTFTPVRNTAANAASGNPN